MAKAAGNSYSPYLPPPRQSSTLPPGRSEDTRVPRRKGRLDKALRPRPPQAYSCSTSRRPTEHNESGGGVRRRRKG